MGRFVKNPVAGNRAAESIVMPAGPTSARPSNALYGSTRFNTSTNKLEVWNGAEWRVLAAEGTLTITKDTFTGDGSTVVFGAMSQTKAAGTEATVQVFVGNVHQNPAVAYTFDGSTNITFTSPPPDTHTIVILYGFDSTVAE